jgi:hypothetical protein
MTRRDWMWCVVFLVGCTPFAYPAKRMVGVGPVRSLDVELFRPNDRGLAFDHPAIVPPSDVALLLERSGAFGSEEGPGLARQIASMFRELKPTGVVDMRGHYFAIVRGELFRFARGDNGWAIADRMRLSTPAGEGYAESALTPPGKDWYCTVDAGIPWCQRAKQACETWASSQRQCAPYAAAYCWTTMGDWHCARTPEECDEAARRSPWYDSVSACTPWE